MDDESKLLLREIRDLQKQQLELLQASLPPSWLSFRFSLRTLLIASTLVAVVLGIAVFLNNRQRSAPRPIVVPPVPVIK